LIFAKITIFETLSGIEDMKTRLDQLPDWQLGKYSGDIATFLYGQYKKTKMRFEIEYGMTIRVTMDYTDDLTVRQIDKLERTEEFLRHRSECDSKLTELIRLLNGRILNDQD